MPGVMALCRGRPTLQMPSSYDEIFSVGSNPRTRVFLHQGKFGHRHEREVIKKIQGRVTCDKRGNARVTTPQGHDTSHH